MEAASGVWVGGFAVASGVNVAGGVVGKGSDVDMAGSSVGVAIGVDVAGEIGAADGVNVGGWLVGEGTGERVGVGNSLRTLNEASAGLLYNTVVDPLSSTRAPKVYSP